MKLPRTTAAAVTITCSAGLLAMLTACGRQAGQPSTGPSSSASTSTAAPSRTDTPGQATGPSQPSSGAPSPAQSAQVLASRLACQWHWPNDVAAPGRVTHAPAVPPVPELLFAFRLGVQAPWRLLAWPGGFARVGCFWSAMRLTPTPRLPVRA